MPKVMPMLHFEIRQEGEPVDPSLLLPVVRSPVCLFRSGERRSQKADERFSQRSGPGKRPVQASASLTRLRGSLALQILEFVGLISPLFCLGRALSFL